MKKQIQAAPIAAEQIAASIQEIAKGMKALTGTRLTSNAIITLLHASTGVGKRDIETVLGGLITMELDWLKRAKEEKQ